jgi:hypothetical protein
MIMAIDHQTHTGSLLSFFRRAHTSWMLAAGRVRELTFCGRKFVQYGKNQTLRCWLESDAILWSIRGESGPFRIETSA